METWWGVLSQGRHRVRPCISQVSGPQRIVVPSRQELRT